MRRKVNTRAGSKETGSMCMRVTIACWKNHYENKN